MPSKVSATMVLNSKVSNLVLISERPFLMAVFAPPMMFLIREILIPESPFWMAAESPFLMVVLKDPSMTFLIS